MYAANPNMLQSEVLRKYKSAFFELTQTVIKCLIWCRTRTIYLFIQLLC